MFKLESYITPILLDYVSKYVMNIKEEDFKVSLWEGEVALHNLDLRLDVLQEELSLPLEFISGHIHDLSIRVPWTKITSEPITIVINTIEFVLKLKNPHDDGAGSSASSSPQRSKEAKKKRQRPSKSEERPPNVEATSSWIVSKIINNISLQCHNIILKYVQEDIVVSMNVQLLSFGSANEKWESAMIDVHPVKVLIRKLVQISDLTICLDKRNAAGQIDVCQEPILYRSSLECRILLKYNANSPESNRITRIGVFTELLDMNISSMQIPLCLRLVKLALTYKPGTTCNLAALESVEDVAEEEQTQQVGQSYLGWIWSMLPSLNFAPEYEDEPTNEVPCHTIDFGFYAGELSFTLKNAEFVNDTHMASTKRIRYSPIVRFSIGGMYFEFVSAEARQWMSAKAGVTSMCIEPLGAFKTETGPLLQSEESPNHRPFLDKSLFDELCLIADKGWGVTNYDEYTARITDDYLVYRSPVLAVDLIKYKAADPNCVTESTLTANRGIGSENGGGPCNRVQYRFLTAGLTFRYTQSLEQVKQLISEFINSYDYPAYYNTETLDGGSVQTSAIGHKLPPPLMEDYDALMQHIPLCTYRFSIQRLTFEVYAKTEFEGSTIPKQRNHSQPQLSQLSGVPALPHCVIYIANVEGSITTPLHPDKLVHTTCQLPEKPTKLLEACYEKYELQVKEISCTLVNQLENRSSRILHIPNFAASYKKILQPQNWNEESLNLRELNLRCEKINFCFTRRELNSSFYLGKCALNYNPACLQRLVRLEAADIAANDFNGFKNNLIDFRVCWKIFAKQQHIWSITVNGLESLVVFKQHDKHIEQKVFSTTTLKGPSENISWLECDVIPTVIDDATKQRKSKTVIGLWLAPFTMKLDANILSCLRCRKFEEWEAGLENVLDNQVINVPSFQSNMSVQSSSYVTAQHIVHQHIPPSLPPLVRRSSRNSLQRRISHPEETIHVSSERDEKLEKDTSMFSANQTEEKQKTMSSWLSYINSYILYVEIDCGTICIAQNLDIDAELTKFLLPRIHLKPSNLEPSKIVNFEQLQAISQLPKEKNDINWTLALNDIGIVSEFSGSDEALLKPFQTTITFALVHKHEKVKHTTVELKEDMPEFPAPNIQAEKVNTQKDHGATEKSKTIAQAHRSNSPVTENLSSGSPTVGGRSDIGQPETAFSDNNTNRPIGRTSPRKSLKNIDAFTFNLHADTSPIQFLISSRKICTFESHVMILSEVIKYLNLSQQSTSENSGEQVSIVTISEENVLLKEFMDLETNTDVSKNSEEKETPFVLLLFCQWTITRISFEIEANPLNYLRSKVIIDFEDLLATVDKREDYTKCTSKVGNLNVNYFEENPNGDWESCQDGLAIRLLGDTTNLPFLNVIFTAVGLNHFFKRIGAKRSGDLTRNLNEIIIKMQAIEIIVNLGRISKFIAAISGFFESSKEKNKVTVTKVNAAHNLPMIHLESKGLTLYFPIDNGKDFCSAAIFRVQKITITPNLENPLQRKPLRADIYAKAAQLGMLGTPGSMIEDRQYELTLENMSAASGSWQQIAKHMYEQRDNFHRTNPAFEWNNQNRKQDLQITEIFNNFTFVAIYAPAIVYQNVLISGEAIEFNCATDYVASFNTNQINMFSCLIVHVQQILCFLTFAEKKSEQTSIASISNRSSAHSLKTLRNNASSSKLKPNLQRCTSIALNSVREARYSTTFNSIDEDIEHMPPTTTSDSGFQSINQYGSISTISSLPQYNTQTRKIPQTISLVAGVFLLKFYKVEEVCEKNIENEIIRKPLLSITLSQPSFMYTQNVYDSIMQISLYDFFIYLSTESTTSPGNLKFNEILVDTRPGQANAAGITPPLFTFRMRCTKMNLRECDIEISKPIAFQFTEEKVNLLCQHLLLVYASLLEDPCFDVRSMRNIVRGTKLRLMRQHCFDADRLHIDCHKIVVRFQSENDSYNCKFVSSDMKFNMKFLNRPEKATAKASIGALYFLVDQKVVLHPVNMRLSADFVSEPWHELPLITAIMKINLLQLDLGINSVLHLQEAMSGFNRLTQDLSNQWQTFLRKRPFENEDLPKNNKNLELLKCPPANITPKSSKTRLRREEFYQDDLRAGAFQFVEMNTDTFLPMPYQIQIIKKNFGIICWRYPQPRKMRNIHVYPVPMAMPNPILIRCSMEYYSEVHETFLHYCDFSLSETVSKKIHLPERTVCANIWRVVIVQSLISVNGACFDDMASDNDGESQKSIASINIEDVFNTERKESDFILHPKVLVGCMRIDTTFESECVPKIQFLLSCNFVTIKVLNQPNQGEKLPSLLDKYKLIHATSISQTFLNINFQNLSIYSALVSSKNFSIETNTAFGIKCLDYGFLNMLPVLEETNMQSCLKVDTNSTSLERDVSVNIVLDRMRLNVGPSIIHSLLTSKTHWEEYLQRGEQQRRHALVPRCIIVNRTYTSLSFGQTGTTERIQLQVREACMYSFRSDYHSQELTFFITDAETQMTDASQPVSITFKYAGEVQVRAVRVGTKCIFIKCRKLSPMQIYIFIKGQIELMSMVPHEMLLDFRFDTKKSIEYAIDKRERACFYYAVHQKSNISMRLKFAENANVTKARSGDIPLRSNKNLPWLVKVPHSKYDFISFWVRIFREDINELCVDNFKPQKVLITIWPIFEICSMMPFRIEAQENTTSQFFTLMPEGNCEILNVPATHLSEHAINLHFAHKVSEKCAKEYVFSLKTIDWKEFFYYDEEVWNVEAVLSELCKSNEAKWPCDDDEELRIKRTIATPQTPAIMYNCGYSRDLSCTLRLEISPWGFVINSTSMTIALRPKNAKEAIKIDSNQMQMLCEIEKCFTIEISDANNCISSLPIYFEETASLAPSATHYYVLSEKIPLDIVILRGEDVIKFVLTLQMQQNKRRVLMLRPKFVVTNFTKQMICVLPFAMDHKETAKRENVEILDQKVNKREMQTIESRDNCMGIAIDYFYDLYAQKTKRTIDTAFVCFVCIKIFKESDISIPIPLSMPFTRRCFSAQNGSDSIAFACTLIEKNGIQYLNIFDDTAPALFIRNETDVKFIVAQTSAAENSKVNSTTPEYAGRNFEWHQLLKSYSHCYYTPPEMYTNFPDIESAVCNLTLALYKENFTKKDVKWSKPIRTDKSWEKFLNIPNYGDVKIVICDKHRVIRVSIFYILQQKEFSVKDLRSRLLTTLPTSNESDETLSSATTQQNSPINKSHTIESCIHHQTTTNSEPKLKTRFRLHTYAKEMIFTLQTESKERNFLSTEVLSIYIDDFLLAYNDNTQLHPFERTLNFTVQNLQIDNQLHSNGKFDFPVIICAQELYEYTSAKPQPHCLDYAYKDLFPHTAPMILLNLKFYDDEMSISEVNCSLSPFRAYIEDAYLNDLFDALVECSPSNCVFIPKKTAERSHLEAGQFLLPRDIAAEAICFAEPLQMRSFRIEPLEILLSVHTSVRLYIALDHSPLSFSTYQRHQILTMPLRLGQSLGMHYLSGAIFGAGWVVGSLEILGSPSGLARSFTTGLRDFVAMPVQGLFRGPWGFIVGVTQGSASLLRNVTAGTVNSLTKLAASVARNLDRLTLDREHIERTEALRRVRPNSLTEGFSQGLTGLGISILGAVGGIAHHTLEARSPVEVVTGVGKGIVGAFTKPISGAAELVALTGQGVLQTVGFNALPTQRTTSDAYSAIREPSAYRIWKLLPGVLSTDQALFYHEITLVVQNQMRCAHVFLTSTVFAILVAQWDKLEFAYPVNKISITRDRDDKNLFILHLMREDANEIEDNMSYTNERIMSFLQSSCTLKESARFSMGSLHELLLQGSSTEGRNRTNRNVDWAFYINEFLGEHLMHYLKILRSEI